MKSCVRKIKKGKRELEADIYSLVSQFEQEFDLTVVSVELEHMEWSGFGEPRGKTSLSRVAIDLKI